MRIAVLALLPECLFVVSEERTRTVKTSERWNAPTPMTAPTPVLAAAPRSGGLDITAVWRRQCSYTGDRILEQRIELGADIDMIPDCDTNGCGIVLVFTLLAAPVTLGISGIVTGIKIARTDDRFVTKVQPLPLRHGTCDEPAANAEVVVTAPGAQPQHARTDANGRARVENVATGATAHFVP